MADTKVLQAILDGQSAIKEELKSEIGKVREDVGGLKEELKKTDKKLTKRIDRLGLDLAKLSDDAPTIEEFDNIETKPKPIGFEATAVSGT